MIDLMHAQDIDLDDLGCCLGFWAQEKYRGVRLYWDGRAAWSRQGREIELPADWYEALPKIGLDCELYDGHDGERRCASVLRYGPKHITPTMRIIAFDCPHHADEPWITRIQFAAGAVEAADFDRIECAPWWKVQSVEALTLSLAAIHEREGEGLILRQPSLAYLPGRPPGFLKMKWAS